MRFEGAFCWYELRTTDVNAARGFYADVAGLDVRDEGGRVLVRLGGQLAGEITVLPAGAAARGAPPHWLGHVAVADVETAAARFVALGAERLGPARRSADGADVALLRDPFGSVVALTSRGRAAEAPGPAWHELNTYDQRRASSTYADLFGWRLTETIELWGELGVYQNFAWRDGAQSVGGVLESANLPGVHPHWVFHFEVGDLDRAVAETVARGGRVLSGPLVTQSGARVAHCEDPQHAAFALRAPAPR